MAVLTGQIASIIPVNIDEPSQLFYY
jgi:hypothetical protein